MHEQTHPDSDQLDRLRAGLLDDEPDTRSALMAHIDGCPVCRARLDDWAQLGPGGLAPAPDAVRLDAELHRARRIAMAGTRRRRPLRYASLATAALLLVLVSAALITLNPGHRPPQIAVQVLEEVPEIYEDIDFYLWLAGQQEKATDDGNGSANRT